LRIINKLFLQFKVLIVAHLPTIASIFTNLKKLNFKNLSLFSSLIYSENKLEYIFCKLKKIKLKNKFYF